MEISGFARLGYGGETVKVEADLRRGIPAVDVVGLPDGAVREARERMRAAIRNSSLEFPRDRILINLSPADLKKEGSSFDLPIALAVLGAADGILESGNGSVMVLGELELSGAVRPVRGVLAAVACGLANGITRFIVPSLNVAEAEVQDGAIITGVSTLAEAYHRFSAIAGKTGKLSDEGTPPDVRTRELSDVRNPEAERELSDVRNPEAARVFPAYEPVWSDNDEGFGEIRGQPKLVRAMQIAAAGGHHLIVYGPPGCGKTLSSIKFPALLPDLDRETAIAATRIHSLAGTLHEIAGTNGLLVRPPFRMPHQSTSLEGMTGGGPKCRPGEISLAHGGTLFLDEAAQFRSTVLQSLRGPLETGTVTVSRAGRAESFPARFQLLLAVNPCPCGNAGSPGRVCTCTPDMVDRYWKRLTAPLLDRIDLRIGVQPPDGKELSGESQINLEGLRTSIGLARKRQWKRNRPDALTHGDRFPGDSPGMDWLNATLGPAEIMNHCNREGSAQKTLVEAIKTNGLSGRAGHGILRTARTIADLDDSRDIEEKHVKEAADFRKWEVSVPDFL